MYVTTPIFLEYFGLTSLKELPGLDDERQLADIARELGIEMPESLTPVVPQSDEEESSEDESEGASAEDINPETSDDDEPLVGGEYLG